MRIDKASAHFYHLTRPKSLEHLPESGRYWRGKLHTLMRDRVVETEHISMETKPSYGVIAVSVLDVTADRVPQVGTVDTYLVLSSRLQPILHQ